MTGHSLCAIFAKVRTEVLGGLPWQAVKVANGVATDMAEAVNAEPGASADVEATMRLLLVQAKDGKAGARSHEIVREPSFAFATWVSRWTSLREELRGVAPIAPVQSAAKPWEQAERDAAARKAKDANDEIRARREIQARLEAAGRSAG